MRISLSFEVACAAPVAWRALHDTATIASVYGPILRMVPVGAAPAHLTSGDRVTVRLRALGFLPMGRQTIAVTDTHAWVDGAAVRTMHDRGGPLSGPLALLRGWHHQMSLTPMPGDAERTRWSDTLEVGGPVAFLYWPALALTWRLRARRIRRLARDW